MNLNVLTKETSSMEYRCTICGKKITNKKSIENKMGKTCLHKFREGYRGIQVRMA